MKTEIFKSFEAFSLRVDKSINGVSPDFAEANQNYESENETNIGCWNCLGSSDNKWCYELTNSNYCINSESLTNCVSCFECSNMTDSKFCNNMISGKGIVRNGLNDEKPSLT